MVQNVGARFSIKAIRDNEKRPGYISIGDPLIDEASKFWKCRFGVEPFGYERFGYGTTPFESMASAIEMVKVILYFKYHDWVFIGEDGNNILTVDDIRKLESD